MDKTNILPERFREVRRLLGNITQQELADRLLLSRNYIAKIESGAQEPSARVLRDLEGLRVRFENTPSTFRLEEETAPHLVERGGGKLELIDLRLVPVISWTHAGAATAYEQIPRHEQERVATSCRDPRSFAVIVEGDSMMPDYKPGDRVILAPSQEPRNGRPVVAKLDDDGIVLRIFHRITPRKIRLASLRPEIYPPIDYDASSLRWVWPVEELNRKV